MNVEAVRAAVSQVYTRAQGPSGAATLAGYSPSDLELVPEEVTHSFFGCGNPLAYARVEPGQTVVDLGSGAGLDLILAGHRVGPQGRVIGVDMTDTMIERARSNVARAGLSNVEVRRGLIEKLPIEDGSADWVISNCVISLSPEKERVFDEVARVLRPGGRMLISDIVVDEAFAYVLRRLRRVAPSVAYAQEEAVYLRAIASAGLVDAVVEDRLVYETSHLLGLFGDEALRESSGACPVDTVANRLKQGWLGYGAVRLASALAAGHVWSAKFGARRP